MRERTLVLTAAIVVFGTVAAFIVLGIVVGGDGPAEKIEKLKVACSKEFPYNQDRANACILSTISKGISDNDRAAIERARRSAGF